MGTNPEEIGPDTPLRLQRAAELAFPNGGMTAAGLRREAGRGRLTIEKIAGKDFTTLAAIKRMRELCRVQQKESGSGSGASGGTPMEKSSEKPSGSSEMDRSRLSQAAVVTIAQELKKPSRNTSPSATSPTPDNVIQIGSR